MICQRLLEVKLKINCDYWYYKILKKESTIFFVEKGKLSLVSRQVMEYCLDFAQKLIPMTSYK